MAIFQETVPKWLYDQKCAEYNTLFAAYEKLRPTHSPVTPLRVIRQEPDHATKVLRATEQAVVDPKLAQIARGLMERDGLSEPDALVEAKRLDDIYRGKAIATGPR